MTKKRKQPPKAKTAKRTLGDYEVGYCKTPVHSRWGPGQSGYPGGRKKGQRNFKTLLLEVFEAEIEITENGRKSTCTVAKALLLTLVQSGLKDRDIRAIARSLELYERAVGKAEDEEKENEALSEQDRDIIRRAMGVDPDQAGGEDDGDDEAEDNREPDEDAEDELGDEAEDEIEDGFDDDAEGGADGDNDEDAGR